MTERHAELASVLGRVPSGLYILTVRNAASEETGMLASWVQQAGFDPPAVSVAVRNGRYLHEWLLETSRAAISIVSESQKELLGHFGKGFEPGEPAFEGLETTRTADGLPVLTDTVGWLAGDVVGSVEAGDHTLFVIQITSAGRGHRHDEKPWIHLRKNGLGY